jgi:hypothetical protein
MILYATAAFFSPLFGRMTNLYTIVPLYVFYWLLTTASFVFMLFFKSNPESIYKLIILAVLLGTVESLNTQLPRSKLILFNLVYNLISTFLSVICHYIQDGCFIQFVYILPRTGITLWLSNYTIFLHLY